MNGSYSSSATEFLLLGLSEDPKIKIVLFIVFLPIYMVTVIGNVILVTACIIDPKLHTPMYFFLSNLSFVDIFYSSAILPNMLVQLLVKRKISFIACGIQMFTYLLLGSTECVLLAVMSYDRYVAITFPLNYANIMRKSVCTFMVVFSWLNGSLMSFLGTMGALKLPLCGHYVIDHFFCESTAFAKIACGDTYVSEMINFIGGVIVLLIPVFFILFTYIRIIITIIRIPSSTGRHKAFSTCASHLIVVTIFFSTTISMYMKPVSEKTVNEDKVISVFYTVMPSMLNPLIYSLRNKDVKVALKKLMRWNGSH
ncbi:olfactory receptor 2D3-like [Pleurodeles waltl]|uniref:olfactory receptor 2D3-like n=1 Tax=Pleurodeles waltl TaxID=8319 RepID=UPI00370989E0